MKISLLILAAPYSTQSTQTALRYARAAIESGHQLYRVFFYHDGVNCGNQLITPPQDEENIPQQWSALSSDHGVDLVVCIASALKRGVIDEAEAARFEKPGNNLQPQFEISGLGQLVDASIVSDRLVSFGS